MISDPYFQMPEFDLSSLMPGDQVFGPIPGFGGPSVFAGQWVLAPWKHRLSWRTWRHVQHTAIVVKAAGPNWRPDGGLVDAPLVGEAEPGGFRLTAIGMERWNPSWIYVRPRWLTEGQGARVAEVARMMALKKTPYGFADYVAIPAHRLRLPVPHLDAFISATDDDGFPLRAICSQANDFALTHAGGLYSPGATAARLVGLEYHDPDGRGGRVFDDGRLQQDVVPSELYLRLLELRPELIIRPGTVALRAGTSRGIPRFAATMHGLD